MNRREFLRAAVGAGACVALGGAEPVVSSEGRALAAGRSEDASKLIVVLFGGGTRSSESIDDSEHRYIPRLWNEMVPRGTLFANMRVEHKVVHPNSAGSVVTGHWEWTQGEYVWKPGHWEKKPKGRKWMAGHWEETPRGWRWVPGHWKR